MEIELTDADSAAKIQAAIDALPPEGGTVVLPELDIEIDRAIEVQSGVTLRGQGASTILRASSGVRMVGILYMSRMLCYRRE